MDNYFKEKENLSESKIVSEIPNKVGESLIMQKLKKTKVMRVNKREEELLMYLRENNLEEISQELYSIYRHCYQTFESKYLKDISRILAFDELLGIDYLIESGFISEEQLELIVNYIKEKRNIILTGHCGVGKTVLMNILLNLVNGMNLTLIENNKGAFNLTDDFFNDNDVSIVSKDLTMNDFLNKNTKVFNEISSKSDALSLITALNLNNSIFTTICFDFKDDLRERLALFFDNEIRENTMETLNRNKFIVVNISMKDRKRIVESIKEI